MDPGATPKQLASICWMLRLESRDDYKEGVAAFMQKRRPQFRGK
jgi:hypothetical protein